jgi:hypothetical protein
MMRECDFPRHSNNNSANKSTTLGTFIARPKRQAWLVNAVCGKWVGRAYPQRHARLEIPLWSLPSPRVRLYSGVVFRLCGYASEFLYSSTLLPVGVDNRLQYGVLLRSPPRVDHSTFSSLHCP